ncbi:MAG: M48 family metalloprotease [Bryobacteraceae bacterium]|nr:M48 family metalloprotease [Bryobacteraceae bacterium]
MCVLIILVSRYAFAQFEPDSASVYLFFPHFLSGDSSGQTWQATFKFHNPHFQSQSICELAIFSSGGTEMPMNLGSSVQSRIRFAIPPQGSRVIPARPSSQSLARGWARSFCTLPVQGIVSLRLREQEQYTSELNIGGMEPTSRFRAPASRSTTISIGNVFATDFLIRVSAFDSEGGSAGVRDLVLCALCQRTFQLSDYPDSFPIDFEGTVSLSAASSTAVFAVAAISSSEGLQATLPPGGASWPTNHTARISTAYNKLLVTAQTIFAGVADLSTARLEIPFVRVINATASRDGTIRINHALAELIGDSQSELAAVIAHEIAHLIQFRAGRLLVNPANAEIDADAVGMLLCLASGYDPYASAGVFGKLMTITRRTDLFDQFFDNIADPHTSFTNRMAAVLQTITAMCSHPEGREYCALYKSVIHPNFPDSIPLALPAAPFPGLTDNALKE